MATPVVGDSISDLNRNIQQLTRALGGLELEGGDVDITEGDITTVNETSSSGGGTRQYFSTGPGGFLLEDAGIDNYREIRFGFNAKTVNIRSTAALFVAFADPHNERRRLIPIAENESPFTIGGAAPIGADRLWLTHQDAAADPSEVHLIAYR